MGDHDDRSDRAQHLLAQLREALDVLPEAVSLYDPQDRLAFCNSRYRALHLDCLDNGRDPDLTFEDVVRGSAEIIFRDWTLEEREKWIQGRLSRHRLPVSHQEYRRDDGRWFRTQERRTADGWSIGIRMEITDSKQREASFRLLFEANPTPMYVVERATLRFVDVNEAALRLYGYDRERFLSMTMLDTRPARDHEAFLRLAGDGSVFDYAGLDAWAHLRADGTEIRVVPHTKSMTLDGRDACIVTIVDITRQEEAEREIRRMKAFLDSVVEAVPLGLFVKDMRDAGRYVIYNRACAELVGRDQHDIVGRSDVEVFGEAEGARFIAQDVETMRRGELLELHREEVTRGNGETRLIATRKRPLPDGDDGELRYLVGIAEDITEREKLAARLDHMAHHDALTGLPNRVMLERRLEALATSSTLAGRSATMLYVDLDGFKGVNDRFGHRVGDALLCTVAHRLQRFVQSPDLACRLGGDEFVVLQSPSRGEAETQDFADALIGALSAAYRIEGRAVTIGASVGIAALSDTTQAESLLRDADVALYASKRAGGGRATVFQPAMEAAARSSRALDAELRRAVERDEFDLFYQPIVNARHRTVIGYEALLRWQHPQRGLVAPGDFVAVAEDGGSIVPIGAWALRRACRDAAARSDTLSVAVNLSVVQFKDDRLVQTVAEALSEARLQPHRLELEVTESLFLAASDRNLRMLAALRGLGVRIALDDFGTGYSSLGYLQRFAFDKVKIDRSFVQGLPNDARALAILRAVMALGRSLGIETTAEGVETADQLACLNREACRSAQGYLFGKPRPGFGWLERVARPARGEAA